MKCLHFRLVLPLYMGRTRREASLGAHTEQCEALRCVGVLNSYYYFLHELYNSPVENARRSAVLRLYWSFVL